jgi:hypothetical protein
VGDAMAWYFCNFPHVHQDRKGWTFAQLGHFSEQQKHKMALLDSDEQKMAMLLYMKMMMKMMMMMLMTVTVKWKKM